MRRMLRSVLAAVAVAAPLPAFVHCSTVPADPEDGGDGVCGRRQIAVDAGDDSGPQCERFFRHPCGVPSGIVPRDDCFFTFNDCNALCGGPYFTCQAYGSSCVDGSVVDQDDAGIVVECGSCPGGTGRRPAGLVARRGPRRAKCRKNELGEYFARAAHLEAASVHAFRIMTRELAAFGAPADLLAAVESARADEVRHAKITEELALVHGGTPEEPHVQERADRDLEAIALENAVEGCVRETFGALVASWQSAHAKDDHIANAMKDIAADETRHAALSWSVAEWALPQLEASARARLDAAMAGALRDLRLEIAAEPAPELVQLAGMPSAATARILLDELAVRLGLAAV